jgi:hypothetical protein
MEVAAFTAAILFAVVYAGVFGAYFLNGNSPGGGGRYWWAVALCVAMPILGWLAYRVTQRDVLHSLAAGSR